MKDQQRREADRVRKLAERRGFRVRRSRAAVGMDNRGEYMLISDDNIIVLGEKFNATLRDIEDWLPATDRATETCIEILNGVLSSFETCMTCG